MISETCVFSFLSQDSYTRQYELDLLEEMSGVRGSTTVAVTSYSGQRVKVADHTFYISDAKFNLSDDVFLLFPYVLFAQMLALVKSAGFGVNPDNPSPDGTVNRVVRGVKIYPF